MAKDLLDLSARHIASKADLKDWYDIANRVCMKLRASDGKVMGEIPELVWHYLSDADVRFKDENYRDIQEEEIERVIEILLRG